MKLTTRKYLLPFALITSLFFLWGFARSILDVANQHFRDEMNISIAQSSWIQVITFLAYFISAVPAGLYISRFGYRRGVVTGLLLFALGAFLFIPGQQWNPFPAFIGCLFIIGVGLAFLETSANPYVTELGARETATSRLNMAQSFNGLGSMLAPALVGAYLFTGGGDIAMPYLWMGFVVLAVAVIFSLVKLPEVTTANEEQAEAQSTSSVHVSAEAHPSAEVHASAEAHPSAGVHASAEAHFSAEAHSSAEVHASAGIQPVAASARVSLSPYFFLGLAALLAYEVAEISINSYFVLFLTGEGYTDKVEASRLLSFALGIFMVGRFVGAWLMQRIRPAVVLTACAIGSVVCMLLILLGGSLSTYALLLNFACESIMFPTIFSLSLTGLSGVSKKRASSLLMMTPVGGCAFFFMGLIADSGQLVLPFLIPLAGFLIVLLFAARSCKKSVG